MPFQPCSIMLAEPFTDDDVSDRPGDPLMNNTSIECPTKDRQTVAVVQYVQHCAISVNVVSQTVPKHRSLEFTEFTKESLEMRKSDLGI